MLRTIALLATSLTLMACQPAAAPSAQVTSPPAAAAPTPTAETAGAAVIIAAQGLYSATSTTAMSITGDVTVTPNALEFSKLGTLRTSLLPAPDPTSAEAMKNQLLGLAAFAELNVEVRKVTAEEMKKGAQPLCGAPVEYLMVATRRAAPGSLALIAFAGKDPPGGKDSRLCATYNFDKP